MPELRAIAKWPAGWADREFGWNHNLIALGDFTIDRAGDPLFEAFTSTGLVPAPQPAGLPRTIFDDPGAEHFYDQIAWSPRARNTARFSPWRPVPVARSTSCPSSRTGSP
ncbi:hypothetical protein [Streptomyces sp. NPDC001970]